MLFMVSACWNSPLLICRGVPLVFVLGNVIYYIHIHFFNVLFVLYTSYICICIFLDLLFYLSITIRI